MAAFILYAALAYLGFGTAFAIVFAIKGAQTIDPAAAHAHWGFRLLVIPGAAALWPVMLRKWLHAGASAEAHR